MVIHNDKHSAKKMVPVSQLYQQDLIAEVNKYKKRSTAAFITDRHKAAIEKACRSNRYSLSVRETGSSSIKRIEQGAKPKPHTILDKSVKLSSLKQEYGETNGEKLYAIFQKLNLDGFVGHWENTQDTRNNGTQIKRLAGFKKKEGNEETSFIPIRISINSQGEPEVDSKEISTFINAHENWATLLYTGDYDLHELYKDGKQINEGSLEKRKAIANLNNEVEEVDTQRSGEVVKSDSVSPIHVNGDFAMFQHGDQATYVANQYLDNNTFMRDQAAIVASVAREDEGALAWCIGGDWYVTENAREHSILRRNFNLVAPSSWNKEDAERREQKARDSEAGLAVKQAANAAQREAHKAAMSAHKK